MKTRLSLVVALLVLVIGVAGRMAAQSSVTAADGQPPAAPNLESPFSNLQSPLLFIENQGQWEPAARFQARSGNMTLWLADDALWLTIAGPESREPGAAGPCPPAPFHLCPPAHGRGVNLRLTFIGANPHSQMEAFTAQATPVSYLVGEPARWRPNVPAWDGVRYHDLYPGLDLELTGENGRLAPRLTCKADCQSALQNVRLRLEGADTVVFDEKVLRLDTAAGPITLPLLSVEGLDSQAAAAGFQPTILPLAGNGFEIVTPLATGGRSAWPADPDAGILWENDADLGYSTYLGGSSTETNYNMTVDANGSVYATGDSYSSDFPTTPGAFDTSQNGSTDVYVAKISFDGSELIYATYIGGNSIDLGDDVAVDSSGAAYVAGKTTSNNFPATSGAYDTTHNGGWDAFALKLNADGNALLYATYLGGGSEDYGEGVVIDDTGAAYVVSEVWSSAYPTTAGAYDTTYGGAGDIGVTKLNASGNGLVYSTFIGGGDYDCWDCDIAIDSEGNIYVTGYTESTNFPATSGAYDTTHNGGWDGYVAKLNAAGSALVYATYLGGSGSDCYEDCAITVGPDGAAYIGGNTYSSGFPTTPGAYDTTNDGRDAFITKLSLDGSQLAYSTFLGGSNTDQAHAIEVDSAGSAYVVGKTSSSDFPTTDDAYDTTHNGLSDVFVVRMNPTGDELQYSTFLGGSSSDCGYDCSLALGRNGAVYLAGQTSSANFPTTEGAFDTTLNGNNDGFAASLGLGIYCGGDMVIPDNDPAGVSQTLTITDTTLLVDMDVSLSVEHTFVGDLIFTLTHDTTGHSVTLIDRPLGPPAPYCSNNNIEATLDDEATDPVEDECAEAIPTIDGTFYPNTPLSVFDLEELGGTWTLNVADVSGRDSGVVNQWCLQPTLQPEPITLVKTVGVNPNECATTDSVAVYAGDEVTYCYQVTNNLFDTLTPHDLEDSELGSLLSGYAYNLEPGATFFVTATAAITETTTNSATWTSYAPNGAVVSDDDTATVIIVPDGCSMPLAAIPDQDLNGVSDDLIWTESGTLADLNVYLLAEHTWVGDLLVDLEHVDTGTKITLINRPGYPPPPSCNGDNIDATLDDEAATTLENECAPSTPTILGDFRPINDLTAFDGENLAGTWRLTVADVIAQDVGVLTIWCMESEIADPLIGVQPAALESTQAPEATVTLPLTLTNSGQADLTWTIDETSCGGDVPWATSAPASGVTAPGESAVVDVTFDAAGLTTGIYTGTLCVNSNDLNTPLVTVPLTLTVVPPNCRLPNLDIPDDNAIGVSDDLLVTDTGTMDDLDVYLQVQHTWVGDLIFTLTHVDTGTAVTLIDRPGGPPPPSCKGDDIDATLDDEATTPVEDVCEPTQPTIYGTFSPNESLSAFDQETLSGAWRLTAADVSGGDTGVLYLWCVETTVTEADIEIDPAVVASTQLFDVVTTQPLTITNAGRTALIWNIVVEGDLHWASVTPTSGETVPGGSDLVTVTFDSTGLETGVYTGALLINSNDPNTPQVTVPLVLTVECQTQCLRSVGIQLQGRQQGSLVGVRGTMLVTNETGQPISGAVVFATWTLPDGSTQSQTATTNSAGNARFTAIAGAGVYTLTIDDIVRPDYTFDRLNSVLSASITYPPGDLRSVAPYGVVREQ
ncbi:MAG: SBBP repeat-containing protein [Chloroflexota bacterium]